MFHPKEFYDQLLVYALVAIRASETPQELEGARKIADMFHNVPASLCFPWTEERERATYEYIQVKAQVHGLQRLLASWEESATQHLAWLAQEQVNPAAASNGEAR